MANYQHGPPSYDPHYFNQHIVGDLNRHLLATHRKYGAHQPLYHPHHVPVHYYYQPRMVAMGHEPHAQCFCCLPRQSGHLRNPDHSRNFSEQNHAQSKSNVSRKREVKGAEKVFHDTKKALRNSEHFASVSESANLAVNAKGVIVTGSSKSFARHAPEVEKTKKTQNDHCSILSQQEDLYQGPASDFQAGLKDTVGGGHIISGVSDMTTQPMESPECYAIPYCDRFRPKTSLK